MNDIDIWRLAIRLIDKHGADAERVAGRHYAAVLQAGTDHRCDACLRILQACTELLRQAPAKGEWMN